MFQERKVLLLACVVALGCGSGSGTDNSYRPETLVSEVECVEMIADFKVPQEVARAKVPSEYEIITYLDGTATLIFITKVCTWDNPEPLDDAETQEVHGYIPIEGELKVVPIPGADVSLPSSYAYNVFLDAKGPAWMQDLLNHYGFDTEAPRELDIDPFGEQRSGYVVEENGSGYRWTESAGLRGSTTVVGQTDYFYHDNENGVKGRAEKSALSDHDAVGWATLEIDPGSKLAEFGSLLEGPTVDMNPMYATYTIWSE